MLHCGVADFGDASLLICRATEAGDTSISRWPQQYPRKQVYTENADGGNDKVAQDKMPLAQATSALCGGAFRCRGVRADCIEILQVYSAGCSERCLLLTRRVIRRMQSGTAPEKGRLAKAGATGIAARILSDIPRTCSSRIKTRNSLSGLVQDLCIRIGA